MSALPVGWFTPQDIVFYRDRYSKIPKNGWALEIGCFCGRSLCSVADIIIKKNISVIAIDTFQELDICFPGESAYHCSDSKEQFTRNITDFGIRDNVLIFQGDSKVILKKYPDWCFDFVFIDGDHSEAAVKEDIINALPLLVKGGVLAGHDMQDWLSVNRAVKGIFRHVVNVSDNIFWLEF